MSQCRINLRPELIFIALVRSTGTRSLVSRMTGGTPGGGYLGKAPGFSAPTLPGILSWLGIEGIVSSSPGRQGRGKPPDARLDGSERRAESFKTEAWAWLATSGITPTARSSSCVGAKMAVMPWGTGSMPVRPSPRS